MIIGFILTLSLYNESVTIPPSDNFNIMRTLNSTNWPENVNIDEEASGSERFFRIFGKECENQRSSIIGLVDKTGLNIAQDIYQN